MQLTMHLSMYLSLVVFPRWNLTVNLHLLLDFNMINLITFVYKDRERMRRNIFLHLVDWVSLVSLSLSLFSNSVLPWVTVISPSKLQSFDFRLSLCFITYDLKFFGTFSPLRLFILAFIVFLLLWTITLLLSRVI